MTPYMILLAALQLLLSRYSTQTDICVGTPIPQRDPRKPMSSFSDCSVNTIVLRGQLADKLTFREFLRQSDETAIAAYEHQDLPFEQLIDSLQLPRSVSHTPLVQVMFQVRNYPAVAPRLDELKTTLLEVDPGTAPFDLNMDVTVTDGRWLCTLNYSTALFDAPTAQRMLSHLKRWSCLRCQTSSNTCQTSRLGTNRQLRGSTEGSNCRPSSPNPTGGSANCRC